MIDFELKDSLIAEIREHHPGQRPNKYKHYGWYEGGMRDAGGWHYEVMLKDSIENLRDCLELLKNPDRDTDPDLLEMLRLEKEQYEAALALGEERGKDYVLGMMRLGIERELFFNQAMRLENFKKNKKDREEGVSSL